jgi:hypothetical protein
MSMRFPLRQRIGVLIFDWPKFEIKLRRSSASSRHPGWVEICNRNESLERAAEGPGVLCHWNWTSDLHAAKVFPSLGLRLMKRAFKDWPIELLDSPAFGKTDIRISFIIGHRGVERLPHLLATFKSIAAQRDVSMECIVVEQSVSREIEPSLPSWVRYIHTPLPYPDMPYCRSWAFNVGANAAKGEVLVFHDNDMLLPNDYAVQLVARFDEGFEVANLKRFIFYLGEEHSKNIISTGKLSFGLSPEVIVQNLEAGGSIAVSKKAFFDIGGFDEAFVGWGGEDNEFWERAKTRKVWPYGYLPLVHLWHSPQSGKFDDALTRKDLYWKRGKEPVETRIRRLISITPGNISGPVTAE